MWLHFLIASAFFASLLIPMSGWDWLPWGWFIVVSGVASGLFMLGLGALALDWLVREFRSF